MFIPKPECWTFAYVQTHVTNNYCEVIQGERKVDPSLSYAEITEWFAVAPVVRGKYITLLDLNLMVDKTEATLEDGWVRWHLFDNM